MRWFTINGYVYTELDFLDNNIVDFVQRRYPTEARKFLNKAGTKGRKMLRQNTKQEIGRRVKKTGYRKPGTKGTGNLLKGSKKGRVFTYRGDETMQIRVKNAAPHAHLFEYGHEIYIANHEKGKKAHRTGEYGGGRAVLADTARKMQTEFSRDADQWIDDLLRRGFSF